MSRYQTIKAITDAFIKANGRREITGPILNSVLNATIDSLGKYYQLVGVAVPTTDPGNPDENVAYIAGTAGTYAYMNNLQVEAGEIAVLKFDGLWQKETIFDLNANLTDYYTKTEVDTALQGKEDAFSVNNDDLEIDQVTGLQFADRENGVNTNGMGYVILRMDKTFAEQVTGTDTIYEIRYDFDLGGASVTIPSGCVLKFDGGKLSNGTLAGNGTEVRGVPAFDSVSFSGTFSNASIVIGGGFTGSVDLYGMIRSFTQADIYLERDITITTKDEATLPSVRLHGNGHTLKVVCFNFANTANVIFDKVSFDCSIAEHPSGGEGGFIRIIGDTSNSVTIRGCKFYGLPDDIYCTYLRNLAEVIFEDSEITGVFDAQTATSTSGRGVFLYNVVKKAKVRNNIIKDISNIAVRIMPTGVISDCVYDISNNFIKNTGCGGIVANGGTISNVVVDNNVILDTNQMQGSSAAENSAINFHGFKNVVITDNYINTPYSTGIDLTGSEAGVTDHISRGNGGLVDGNTIISQGIALSVVADVTFSNNIVQASGKMTIVGYGIKVVDCDLNLTSIASGSEYAIVTTRGSSYTWNLGILIQGCRVNLTQDSTSAIWLYCNSGTGEVAVNDVTAKDKNGGKATFIDNTIFNFIDGYVYKTLTIDLSKEERQIILDRSDLGFIKKEISVYAIGSFSVSPAVTLGVGFIRQGVARDDTKFGTIEISGAYSGTASVVSIPADKSNRSTYVGDTYLYCPGGGTGIIELQFKTMTKYMRYF